MNCKFVRQKRVTNKLFIGHSFYFVLRFIPPKWRGAVCPARHSGRDQHARHSDIGLSRGHTCSRAHFAAYLPALSMRQLFLKTGISYYSQDIGNSGSFHILGSTFPLLIIASSNCPRFSKTIYGYLIFKFEK